MEFTIGLIVGLTFGYILHKQHIKTIGASEDMVKWIEENLKELKKMNDEHDRRFKEAEETIKNAGRRYPRRENK